jgi:vesicle-associated membrane protein 7
MPIVLGLVIVDGELKAEYPSGKEKLRDVIVEKVLPKLAPSDHKRTLTQKEFEFHYKREGPVTIFCVANTDTKKRVCWNFIDEVAKTYLELGATPSKKKIKEMLKKVLTKWNDPNSDQITVLNEKIDEVKGVMIDNIDKLIDRGEKLEKLVDDTDKLSEDADKFKSTAKKVKNRMLFRLIFLIVLLVFIVLAVIIAAVFIGCGFPKFDRCLPTGK